MKCFCAIAVAGVMSGLVATARAELENAIEIVVNKAIVTRFQVYSGVAPFLERLRTDYGGQPEVFRKKLEDLQTDVRKRLLENQLILNEFNTAGYTLPESVIDDYVQSQIRSGYTDRATLTKSLHARGITFERFRKGIRDQFIVTQMRLKNVSEAIIISPHKIESYYKAHMDEFKVNERIKLRMIVLLKREDDTGQVRKLADEVLGRIKGGASFAQMATEFSQGSERTRGGERDWEETAPLQKDVAEAVAHLKPGEMSDVIETPETCYILKVEDKSAAHTRTLNEVRNEIEARLMAEEQNRLQNLWIEKLNKKTFVLYFTDKPAGTNQGVRIPAAASR